MKISIVIIIALLFCTNIEAKSFWSMQNETPTGIVGEQKIKPKLFKIVQLNNLNFKLFQMQIPKENAKEFPVIQIPNPDGDLMDFYIFENPIMEAGLAAKYPDIKTYTIISTSNALITGKVDYTFWGFHAMIFNGDNTFFIDPYLYGNRDFYQCYYKRNFIKPLQDRMQCLIEDEQIHDNAELLGTELTKNAYKTFGVDKRVYRLALACTIEYSQAVGGATPTKASVLSAMVTTMNRVNGVFERDFSMKLSLIANTDTLIFLSGTDPYTNNSGGSMLGQNQTTVTNYIGSANYDIGHVFSTGGGGIANLGCVCSSSQKARGVTGSSNPVGDPFDIDYVAHEMGHQFGGSHTFNSGLGSCSGNRSSQSAYEPGSATTIMGYAGICGSDNIQNFSDDYYHARSLKSMSDFMESGGNCAVKTASGNTPPAVNVSGTYYIPYKTSFEIQGIANDIDGDPITYCWEEYDLGSQGSWDATSSTAPIFRSFYPDTSALRVFPTRKQLLLNTIKYKGEVLPEQTRNVSLKLTVRDLRLGYGTFNYIDNDIQIEAQSTTTLFRVTSQNTTGISVNGNSQQNITWDVAGTDIGLINTPTVDIYLSVDSGKTWPFILASNIANDGNETVTMPNYPTSIARLKVKGHNNIFFDLNDNYFTIIEQPWPVAVSEMDKEDLNLFPNPSKGIVLFENKTNKAMKLKVYDMIGKEISLFENCPKVIDLSFLPKAVYILQFENNKNQKFVRKLVLE